MCVRLFLVLYLCSVAVIALATAPSVTPSLLKKDDRFCIEVWEADQKVGSASLSLTEKASLFLFREPGASLLEVLATQPRFRSQVGGDAIFFEMTRLASTEGGPFTHILLETETFHWLGVETYVMDKSNPEKGAIQVPVVQRQTTRQFKPLLSPLVFKPLRITAVASSPAPVDVASSLPPPQDWMLHVSSCLEEERQDA